MAHVIAAWPSLTADLKAMILESICDPPEVRGLGRTYVPPAPSPIFVPVSEIETKPMIKQRNEPAATNWQSDDVQDSQSPIAGLRNCRPLGFFSLDYQATCPICGRQSLVMSGAHPSFKVCCGNRCRFKKILKYLQSLHGNESLRLTMGDPGVVFAHRLGNSQEFEICSFPVKQDPWIFTSHTYRGEPPQRSKIVETTIHRATQGFTEKPVYPLGQLEAVQAELRQKCLRLEARGNLRDPLGEPDWANVQEHASPVDRALLEYLRDKPSGQIHYAAGCVFPAHLTRQICWAWSDRRINLIVRGTIFRQAVESLRKHFGDQVGVIGKHHRGQPGRITIIEQSQVRWCYSGLERSDLTLLSDATLLATKHVYEQVLDHTSGAVFGLLPIGRRLTPFENGRVRALLGNKPLYIHEHGLTAAEVSVVIVKSKGGVAFGSNCTLSMVKRKALSHHGGRNRWIWQLVRAHIDDLDAAGRCSSVLIVVENEEHRIALNSAVGANRRPRQAEVVLFSELEGLQLPQWVFRADGGAGAPSGLQDAIARSEGHIIICDVVDRHHPLLKRLSSSRVAAYQQLGWPIVDIGRNPSASSPDVWGGE